ncbi:MAG TPA: CBS domain-containing protein [Candidatus Binatia bacterium]
MSLREFCQRKVISISPESNILEACRLMETNNIGCLVVQERGKMCGILTDRDIALKVTGESRNPQKTKAREVMSHSPVRIPVEQSLQQLTNLMRVHRVRRVPIVNGMDEVLGIVTMDDIIALLSGEMSDLGRTVGEMLPTGTA